ncbi:MAG: hypothetical protein AAFP17_18555 [Pseudomonadota bacterium]
MGKSRWTETIDRVGGKIAYRLIGCVTGLLTLVTLYAAWSGFSGGNAVSAVVMLAIALGFAWLTRWCWSPKRRLADMDER